MPSIAIIPARGGSKRIPGKNIRNFLGKPIIQYSIESALKSKLFDTVMVSTDDEQIAKISVQAGAEVPFLRSEGNSGDFATTVDVILEVLDTYSKQNKNYDLGCCIYPTAPFISTEMLQNANNLLLEKNYETVFPVVQFDYPIQRSLQKDEQNKVSMVWPEFLLSRSQDLPARYHDCGMFYWFKSQQLYCSKRLFTENSGSIVVSPLECHDIDSPTDWHMAELKYQYLKTLNNS